MKTNPRCGISVQVLRVDGGFESGSGPHGQLAESTHLPGSWLGPAADCEAPGFQTSSEGPEGLGRDLALESWWGPCACAELEKERLKIRVL